jgi:hypothetical protein
MALTVEDGSGIAAADSYVSLADASTIATALGLTFAISGDDEALAEQALRRATLWLDSTYRSRFPGWRTHYRLQGLEWPRQGAYDQNVVPQYIAVDEIPTEIKKATVIAAVREKASAGSLSPDVTPGQIKKSVSVEGAVSVEYAIGTGGVTDQRPVVTMIDDVLASLLPVERGPALFGSVTR